MLLVCGVFFAVVVVLMFCFRGGGFLLLFFFFFGQFFCFVVAVVFNRTWIRMAGIAQISSKLQAEIQLPC